MRVMSRALGLSVLLGLAAAVPVPAAERTVQDTVVLNADGRAPIPGGQWTLLVVTGDSERRHFPPRAEGRSGTPGS
jgi:hypothetical protein